MEPVWRGLFWKVGIHAVWTCWAGFKGVLWMVGSVLTMVPRTSLASYKASYGAQGRESICGC